MRRRDFIQLSTFATAAISFPLLNSCSPPPGAPAMSEPTFLSRLFDEKTVVDAGKAYLGKYPAENNKSKLIRLLSDNSSIAETSDEKRIHQFLDERITKEFEAGKTVLVKGWVLAVTEARQCALFSLMHK